MSRTWSWIRRGLLVCMLLPCMSLLWTGAARSGENSPFGDLLGPGFNIDGKIDFLGKRGIVVLRQYATLTFGDYRIRARNMIYFRKTNHVYAEGDVLLEDASGTTVRADKMYVDINKWWGRAYEVEVHSSQVPLREPSAPTGVDVTTLSPATGLRANEILTKFVKRGQQPIRMNVFAADARMISKGHMEATHVWASPSNFAEPHWRFQSAAAHIRPDEKVEAYHNVLKIGKVPVFYIPYLVYDLKYNWPWLQVQGGYDKAEFGAFTYLRWGWDVDNDDSKWFEPEYFFWDTDFRQNRGISLGGNMLYRTDKPGGPSGGVLRGYLIPTEFLMSGEEADERARKANMVEFPTNKWEGAGGYDRPYYRDEVRFMLDWEHIQKFDSVEQLDVRAFAHYFSDRDVQREYAPDRWVQNQEALTNVDIRWLDDIFELELVAQPRVNDFQSQPEYLPEFRGNIPGARLLTVPGMDIPLLLTSDIRAGVVKYKVDNMRTNLGLLDEEDRYTDEGETPYIARVHQETKVSAPIDLKVATLTPWVGGRSTFYSDTYDRTWGGDGADVNAALIYGADLGTRMYGFYNNRTIRHMIEPKISFIAQEGPRLSRHELFNVDDVDNYRESHMLQFRLHQNVQVKDEDGNARTFFSMNLSNGVILENAEADEFNNNERFTDVNLDAAIYPTKDLAFWGNMTWSPRLQGVSTIAGGVDWRFYKRFRFYLTHAYRPSVAGYDSNITTVALRSQLWNETSPYAVEVAGSYEWNGSGDSALFGDGIYRGGVSHGIQEVRFGIERDFDTFVVKATYSRQFTTDGGYEVFVKIIPKGWVGVRKDRSQVAADVDLENTRYGRAGRALPESDSAARTYWEAEGLQGMRITE